jgi:hypothetical protein
MTPTPSQVTSSPKSYSVGFIVGAGLLGFILGGTVALKWCESEVAAAKREVPHLEHRIQSIAFNHGRAFLDALVRRDFGRAALFTVQHEPVRTDPDDPPQLQQTLGYWLRSRVESFLRRECPGATGVESLEMYGVTEFTDPTRERVRVKGELQTNTNRTLEFEMVVQVNGTVVVVAFSLRTVSDDLTRHPVIPYTPF